MARKYDGKGFRRLLRRLKLPLIVGLVAAGGFFGFSALKKPEPVGLTFQAVHDTLRIIVKESGTLRALRNQDISSQVQGQTSILEIVDEGTVISREDVEAGRILVKLDSSSFEEQLDQEEIRLHNAESNLTEAKENYEIQLNRNDSSIRAGELKVEFARMDLGKYLGEKVTAEVLAAPETNLPALVDHPELAGEADRRKKQLLNAIELAREELSRARDRLDWTEKLEARGYATRSEMEADRLALQRRQVDIEQAEMAYDLFVRYDFTKETTRFLSDYREAGQELERARANARAQVVQARSRVVTNEASFRLIGNRVQQIKDQIDGCILRATQPGIVVYATSSNPWRTQAPIEAGVQVRRYQTLIQLPDITEMVMDINVSEASIDRVAQGQSTTIRVDAFPDRRYTGRVHRVALLPDASMRMMNPDINVYKVQILLDGSDTDLRPGMSAQAEILVKEKADVLIVPVSAVRAGNGGYAVTRLDRGLEAQVPVTLGISNENYVEITSGLSRGETVKLYAQAALPGETVETPRHERLAPDTPAGREPAAESVRREDAATAPAETRGSGGGNGRERPAEARGAGREGGVPARAGQPVIRE